MKTSLKYESKGVKPELPSPAETQFPCAYISGIPSVPEGAKVGDSVVLTGKIKSITIGERQGGEKNNSLDIELHDLEHGKSGDKGNNGQRGNGKGNSGIGKGNGGPNGRKASPFGKSDSVSFDEGMKAAEKAVSSASKSKNK